MDLTIIRIHVKKILTGNFVFMSLVAIIFGILTLFSKGQEKIIGSYTYIDMLWKPFFCIVDDTTASKTKPSSQALHPIEDAYFHQSHLKGKQDYGHQAVAVMLSCWYTSEKIINTFAAGGFHTIGALKTNRMLYPFGFKKKLNEFAAFLTSTRSNFRLVTVKKQKYYVYRYEGKLNGIENAVVLLSYPEKAFGNPKALRAFLSTDVSLSLDETLSYYVCR